MIRRSEYVRLKRGLGGMGEGREGVRYGRALDEYYLINTRRLRRPLGELFFASSPAAYEYNS